MIHIHFDDGSLDYELYNVLCNIVNNSEIYKSLTSEEQVFAEDLKREFESSGVHITDVDKKNRVLQLQNTIASLESRYIRNIYTGDSNFSFGPVDDQRELAALREYLLKFTDQQNSTSKHLVCPSQRDIVSQLLSSLHNGDVRKALWQGFITVPADNAECLGALIKTRQLLAKELGYKSFAHKILSTRMIRTPDRVWTMLGDVLRDIESSVEDELSILGNGAEALLPWNAKYLMQQFIRQKAQAATKDAQHILKSYLPLSAVFNGLKHILYELFSIDMVVTPVPLSEAWGWRQNQSNNGMYRVVLSNAQEYLGTVYIDVYQRTNKLNQAAHLTLQCGCLDTKVMFDRILNGQAAGKPPFPRQASAVILLFNFDPSSQQDPLLSLQELETFYHEFGHGLHSLLSRTNFQHLSGTRGGVDFIEVR